MSETPSLVETRKSKRVGTRQRQSRAEAGGPAGHWRFSHFWQVLYAALVPVARRPSRCLATLLLTTRLLSHCVLRNELIQGR